VRERKEKRERGREREKRKERRGNIIKQKHNKSRESGLVALMITE